MSLVLVLAELTAEEAFTLLVGRGWASSRWQRSALRSECRILRTAATTAELDGLARRWCRVLWRWRRSVLTSALHVGRVSIIIRTTFFHDGVVSVLVHRESIHWIRGVYWLHDAIGAVERAVFTGRVGVGVPRTSAVTTSCRVVWLVVTLLTVTITVITVPVLRVVAAGVVATKAVPAWGSVWRLTIWIEVCFRATIVAVVATSRRLMTDWAWTRLVTVVAGAAAGWLSAGIKVRACACQSLISTNHILWFSPALLMERRLYPPSIAFSNERIVSKGRSHLGRVGLVRSGSAALC